MTDDIQKTTGRSVRFARLYTDGSMNVASMHDTEASAIRAITGSHDDDDTELVEVEVHVIRRIAHKGLQVVRPTDPVREALEQALDCIRGEQPEDCTPDEARENTIKKLRAALRQMESSHADA